MAQGSLFLNRGTIRLIRIDDVEPGCPGVVEQRSDHVKRRPTMDTDLAPPFGGTDPDLVRSPPIETRASQQAGFAQFAVKAVDRQFGRLSGALNGVADSIEEFVDRPDSPVDETLKGYAASASEKLRSLAERTGDQDAAEMLGSIRRAAVDHPVATAGIGAAIGAALGFALVAFGRSGVPSPAGATS
jgi:ElaB/YqjD/DUF883 family membrane-anchored ribosome-binding protein